MVGLLAALALAGCRSDSKKDAKSAGSVDKGAEKVTLRLGYFPNITHAPGLVGVEKGIFAEKLGSNVSLAPQAFNAGPAAVEAIFSGAIDATYIGPNPAINAFAKSNGEAIRIISGATSGGAFLVVQPLDHLAGRSQGEEHRHPAAGQHAGRGAAQLAQGQQAEVRRPGRRRRQDHAAGERPGPRGLQDRHHRRCLGPRAVGHPDGPGGQGQGPARRAAPSGPAAST